MDPETIGPYRIELRLGSGGMGTVYQAWDERLKRRVAIKSIHPADTLSAQRRERLRREAQAVAGLSHPSVAQVYDILSGEHDREYIVMELVEGASLAALLIDSPLKIAQAVDLARQICGALQAAHDHGVVHRDLKAENILVTPDGVVKILDFGLAKRFDDDGGEDSLTEEGVVMGTSRAMSPEQAEALDLDQRSDLFALGSLLYEMVTGRHPFQASTPLETMERIVRHRPPPPRRLNPYVSRQLSQLIETLLAKAPDDRPATARDVASVLGTLADEEKGVIGDHAQARPRRRWPWIVAAALAAVALVITLVILS